MPARAAIPTSARCAKPFLPDRRAHSSNRRPKSGNFAGSPPLFMANSVCRSARWRAANPRAGEGSRPYIAGIPESLADCSHEMAVKPLRQRRRAVLSSFAGLILAASLCAFAMGPAWAAQPAPAGGLQTTRAACHFDRCRHAFGPLRKECGRSSLRRPRRPRS